MTEASPYRLFHTQLIRRQVLTPHMARLTFGGEDIRQMRTCAADQRIKIFFPTPDGRPPALPDRPDWYALYKAEDPATRPPMRTYTIRHLRADQGELDVDFVLHGEAGPASRWALNAPLGDVAQIRAPNAEFTRDPTGYEWKPPADARHILLIADETALPALAGALEDLATRPHPPTVQAFVEIPDPEDALDDLPSWKGLRLEWLPRDGADHGACMIEAAHRALTPVRTGVPVTLEDVDIEAQLPWDRAAPDASAAFYGWVAGESSAVMAIRKLLIQERGLDRTQLNLMGYWRLGRALE